MLHERNIMTAPQIRQLSDGDPRTSFLTEARQHLEVALQPIVDMNTGKIFSCESLTRNFAALDFREPGQIFDHAVQIGVLPELEQIIFEKVISKVTSNHLLKDVMIFINLDGRSLQFSRLLDDTFSRVIKNAGLEHEDICIEISEKNQVLTGPRLENNISTFCASGFKIALDDFGVGYSGLQMLYQANPDFIKIDRFFIENLNTDSKKRFFVQSLTSMAHTLGIKVIAEGVETDAEHHIVRDLNCDLVQGYFVSPPTLNIEEIRPQYLTVSENKDRRKSNNKANLIDFIDQCQAVDADASIDEIFRIFQKFPYQPIVPILDRRGIPIGIVRETDIKPILYSKFGRELLMNKSCQTNIKSFMRPIQRTEIHSTISELLDINSEKIEEGLLITENMKYAGYLSATSLLKLTYSHRLHEMRNQNPLSGLPGNDKIHDFINLDLRTTKESRFYIYFDLNNFKPFNDKYGFRIGDRAILMFCDILKLYFSKSDNFLGHIGGDDFFTCIKRLDAEKVQSQVCKALLAFRHEAESLYSPEDRELGYIEGKRRDGTKSQFSLLSCSAAIIELPVGATLSSVDDLSQRLAKLKKIAKSSDDGIAFVRI